MKTTPSQPKLHSNSNSRVLVHLVIGILSASTSHALICPSTPLHSKAYPVPHASIASSSFEQQGHLLTTPTRASSSSALYGIFKRKNKEMKDDDDDDDEEEDEDIDLDSEELEFNLTNVNASTLQDLLEDTTTSKTETDGVVPADAVVLGVSSSFPASNLDSITEEETSKPEKKSKKSKKTKKSKTKLTSKTKPNLFLRMFRTPKTTPSISNTQSLSLENATQIDSSSSSDIVEKKRKFRLLPKRWTTYVSAAVLLLLAAPVPKRFSSFLVEDDYKSAPNNGQVYQPPRLSPNSEQSNQGEWWKEGTESTIEKTPPKEQVIASIPPVKPKIEPQHESATPSPKTQTRSLSSSSTSFVAAAVQKIGPSVVRIDTEIYVDSSDPFSSLLHPFHSEPESDDQLIRSGQGSGIIFSHHGLVLTNAHVVEGANRVYVTLTDGRKYVAEVTGADEMVDIAVLKILEHAPWGGHSPWGSSSSSPNPNNSHPNNKHKEDFTKSTSSWKGEPLPVANLGDSNHLQVGEFVIAVGNPGGLDNTVTMGIVSSLKRSSEEIGLPSKKVTFIQTDAAVNPGNSGGPLVNEHGEIIGMNTCIRANMEGIAFAIPINKAKEIMFDLAQGKNIQHGYIGVVMMTVTPDFARQNNQDPNSPVGMIPEVHGVMIERVLGNTPASIENGLRRLDIVLEIGGITVKNAGEAATLVDGATVGKDLEVTILRAGKKIVTRVKPEDLAEKIRQKKQLAKRAMGGSNSNNGSGDGGAGGRIYVFPSP